MTLEQRLKRMGVIIRTERKACKMTQLQLAQAIGNKSAASINWIETGRRNIVVKDLLAIMDVLGINDANYLLDM